MHVQDATHIAYSRTLIINCWYDCAVRVYLYAVVLLENIILFYDTGNDSLPY